MKRVRVKICGITREADARAAVTAGADAIGFVFYADSPRHVDLDEALAISRSMPPFVARVALFLDAAAADVQAVIDRVRPSMLQFHGRETPEYCRAFDMPYIKTVPMGEADADPAAWAGAYPDAHGLLLDANRAGAAGGQGQRFEWHNDTALPDMPLVIAGGLDADNVGAAIRRFAPYAVDVSSGVESAPGVKDPERMHAFVDAVTRAG